MPEFKINAVSQEVRSFETKFGQMKSYKLKLEGVESVVELAQKDTTPAPVQGQTLTGSIDYTGQYGPKFKKEAPAFGGGGGGGSKPSYQPKDEKAIQAMWAIGQAVSAVGPIDPEDPVSEYGISLKNVAVELFRLVDEVKTGNTDVATEQTVIPTEDAFNTMPGNDFDKPVDLADIPFN